MLANELLATRLALSLGLPMADVQIIEVPKPLINESPDLCIEIAGRSVQCASGLQLGSRYAAELGRDSVLESLPQTMFSRVVNRLDFVKILAFDKWAGNCDGRQAVFTKRPQERRYRATFIDQGYCFNAAEWSFPDLALLGTYPNHHLYHEVRGWEFFEPTLSQIEAIEYEDLWRCAAQIPHDWIEYDGEGLFLLIEALYARRFMVRDLIRRFHNSSRDPFPNWVR